MDKPTVQELCDEVLQDHKDKWDKYYQASSQPSTHKESWEVLDKIARRYSNQVYPNYDEIKFDISEVIRSAISLEKERLIQRLEKEKVHNTDNPVWHNYDVALSRAIQIIREE